MVRLLLALGLFIINITAAAYVVDANNIVAVLEGIFGNISNDDEKAGLIFGVALGSWFTIGLSQCFPRWRADIHASLSTWPLPGRPYLGLFVRSMDIVLIAIIVSFGIGSEVRQSQMIDDDILLFIVLFIVVLVFLFDLRKLLFPDVELGELVTRDVKKISGWALPDSITPELMNDPRLKLELARDLRARTGQLRRNSMAALMGIGILLVVAVNVIIFAGYIANLGVGQTDIERADSLLEAEKRHRDNVQNLIDRNERELVRLINNFALAKQRATSTAPVTRKPIIEEERKSLTKKERDEIEAVLLISNTEYRRYRLESITLKTRLNAREQTIKTRVMPS